MKKHQWAYERFGWTDLSDGQRRLFESIEMDLMPLRRDLRRLMEAEAQTEARRERLAGAYNRGFRSYEMLHRTCTPGARTIIERFLDEGGKLAGDIVAYRCEDCLERWDLVLPDDDLAVRLYDATTEEAEAYDAWFRAEVEAAMASDQPGIPHDEAMARMQAIPKDGGGGAGAAQGWGGEAAAPSKENGQNSPFLARCSTSGSHQARG